MVYGSEILKLDAATGKQMKTFAVESDSASPAPDFGHISVSGDLLVATAAPLDAGAKSGKTVTATRYASGSQRLVVFDRHSGKQLWQRKATFNFRHNNISLAAGKVFCLAGSVGMVGVLLCRLRQFSRLGSPRRSPQVVA